MSSESCCWTVTRARNVFVKVREVRAEIREVCLAPDRPALPVEEFQLIVSRLYGGLPIEKYVVPYEAEHFLGMVEVHKNKIVIYVQDNDDPFDVRFICVKELCHGLIDEDEDRSANGVQTLEYLLEEYRVVKNAYAEAVAQSEVLAEVAAIELLYPFDERCRDITKLASGELSLPQLADFYKIPPSIVERALQCWFHTLAETVWRLVDELDASRAA